MIAGSSLVFTNTDPLYDFPTPSIAKVVDIGGITTKDAQNLTEVSDLFCQRNEGLVVYPQPATEKRPHLIRFCGEEHFHADTI